MTVMAQQLFSAELEKWLQSDGKKTLESLEEVFQGKSFAIIILLLMAFPALPIPTGGITHVFEVIVMLLSLEMIAGRKTVWLPKKWRKKELSQSIQGKFVPYFIRRIRWFEKYSRRRLDTLLNDGLFTRFTGLILLLLAFSAAVAPPFSGLDTLPALGAVIVALSIVLGDVIIFMIGNVVGAIGIGLIFVFGSITISIFRHFI